MKQKLLTGISLVGSLALLGSFGACHAHFGHGYHHHFDARHIEKIANRIASRLDLDDGQKVRFQALTDKVVARMTEIHKQHGKLPDAVIAQFESDRFDRQALNSALQGHEQFMRENREFAVSTLEEFHSILTPQQRAKVVEFIKKRTKKRGE